VAKYPESPKFNYSYGLEETFKTIVSEFDGMNEQRRRLTRFPKRSVSGCCGQKKAEKQCP
jgi:hypothetical protein